MITFAVVAAALSAPQWPEWRGPHRDGHAHVEHLPLRWNEEEGVAWKTAIPGEGWSTPVVRDERVWITTSRDGGKRLGALAVSLADGSVVHDVDVFSVEKPEKKNKLNSYASPTSVVDAEHVFVHFGTYGTACLECESGEVVWRREDIHCDHMEGPGSSLLMRDDSIVFNMDGGDVQYVICLDKRTGETRWKTPRSTDYGEIPKDRRKAFGTPILFPFDGGQHLVSTGAEATTAFDPISGRELWTLPHKGFSMSSRAVTDGELLVINTGFMKPYFWGVRLDVVDGVPVPKVLWKYRRAVPTIPSPLLVDRRLYFVSNGGVASCIHAVTGELIWKQRIGGDHCASPIYGNGRIYFFDQHGESVVIEAGDEYRELAKNRLDAGFMASPAAVEGSLILRTRTHLYRVTGGDGEF